jgi:predicted enzyme related to lactoylglutathione lyase
VRYAHTNIIARDWRKVSAFYQRVFGCKPVPPERDLSGAWVDALTGIAGAHITGEHLTLPGYDNPPTLEIFSYNGAEQERPKALCGAGLAHIAFEVDDVAETLRKVLDAGGGQVGDVVTAAYPGGVTAVFVYAKDVEGNIIELQSWKRE